MNSTLKSLLFWMVLVVVGVLIWNFSTKYQSRDHQLTFSEFMAEWKTLKPPEEILVNYGSWPDARALQPVMRM